MGQVRNGWLCSAEKGGVYPLHVDIDFCLNKGHVSVAFQPQTAAAEGRGGLMCLSVQRVQRGG